MFTLIRTSVKNVLFYALMLGFAATACAQQEQEAAPPSDAAKNRMAKYFKEIFTKVLQEGGYSVVDSAAKDVLLLRPAIINLEVNAPDILRAGMEATFVASAGEMTLYMELYDSLTSDLLAKVIDAEEAGGDGGYAGRANRVTNKADADRVLRHWANILKKHLDSVRVTGK